MVATVISATVNAYGLDRYLSPSTAAHDQLNPEGPSERVAQCSTIGDCQPESFLFDVRRVREDFGKTNLELETYHVILSHSHEELDPDNEFHVWLAHQFAREEMTRAFPGRQIKIVTQADNGRWEVSAESGEKVWVKGKIHSHCQVANVAEEAVTLTWQDKDGNTKTAHYPAGRAFSSEMKNIYRVRAVTDEVVLEMFAYDNEAYMQACRGFSSSGMGSSDMGAGPGDRKALARQAEGKTSHYEELRMRLRVARATATDWDDFTAQLAADGVHVQRRGGQGDGVSYKWLDTPAARAGGRSGVGDEYKFRAVVEQCERNAEALARGEELEVPERSLVVPTNSQAAERPRPVYQTADGKPPWEQGSDAYAEYVRQNGGTYEGLAAQAAVAEGPVEGIELVRDGDSVTATVGTGVGPLVMDIDRELTARAAALDQREAGIDTEVESRFEAHRHKMNEWWRTTGHPEAKRKAADLVREEMAGEIADAQTEAEKIVTGAQTAAEKIHSDARSQGYREGTDLADTTTKNDRDAARRAREDAEATRAKAREEGLALGKQAWEAEQGDDYRAEIREEANRRAEQKLKFERGAVKAQLDSVVKREAAAEADRRAIAESLAEAQEVLDKLSAYENRDAVYHEAAKRREIEVPLKDGGTRKVQADVVLDRDVEALLAQDSTFENGESIAERQARLGRVVGSGRRNLSASDQRVEELGKDKVDDSGFDEGLGT